MRSNYKTIGEIVERVDIRNDDGSVETLIGLSIEKCFIRSVANTIGTDLTKYKKITKNQFAVSLMQVSRDAKIPVACLKEFDEAIMSPAYSIFQVKDENVILPEYLDMWFKRSEFDREAAFIAIGGVRGSMPWDEFAKMELPVPSIEKQRNIVKAYKTITDRIAIKRKINDNLEALLAARFGQIYADAASRPSSHLEKIISFGNGKSRPSTTGNIPVYGGNGVLSYTDRSNTENAVLIGRVGAYCGSVYIEEHLCWVSDNAIVAKSRMVTDQYFDYFLLKGFNLYDHHVGTGQQLLTQRILNALECPEFDQKEMEAFNREARPVFSIINANNKEIVKLVEVSSVILFRLSGQAAKLSFFGRREK